MLVMADGRVHKLVDGKPVEDGWPKGAPGERMQCLEMGGIGFQDFDDVIGNAICNKNFHFVFYRPEEFSQQNT